MIQTCPNLGICLTDFSFSFICIEDDDVSMKNVGERRLAFAEILANAAANAEILANAAAFADILHADIINRVQAPKVLNLSRERKSFITLSKIVFYLCFVICFLVVSVLIVRIEGHCFI